MRNASVENAYRMRRRYLADGVAMIYKETTYGYQFGPVTVERGFSDEKKGWVTILVKTKKYPHGLQLYVTKTGKVRLFSAKGEFKEPK